MTERARRDGPGRAERARWVCLFAAVACAIAGTSVGCGGGRARGRGVPPDGGGVVDTDGGGGTGDDGDVTPGEDSGIPVDIEETIYPGRANSLELAVDATGTPHALIDAPDLGGLVHAMRTESGWTMTPLESGSGSGYFALVASPDGALHAAYIVDYDLRYARYADGRWTFESVDPTSAAVGLALTVGQDSRPRIAYQHQRFDGGFTADELHFAERSATGRWTTELVHADRYDIGWMPSIAVDSMGTVAIVYCEDLCYTQPDMAIKEAGGAWEHFALPEGIGRSETTIVIDAMDRVHMAWMENGDGTAMYAWLTTEGWATSVIDPSFANVGGRVHILPGADGSIHAFYAASAVRYAALDLASGVWTIDHLDEIDVEFSSDVRAARDAAGSLHVAYAWRNPDDTFMGETRYRRYAP